MLKRGDPDGNEEVILFRTMLDLIKPKLVFLDLPLFMALLSDLFPGVELPPADGGALRAAIETELKEANLQVGRRSVCNQHHTVLEFVHPSCTQLAELHQPPCPATCKFHVSLSKPYPYTVLL
jgi:hypothetical protein